MTLSDLLKAFLLIAVAAVLLAVLTACHSTPPAPAPTNSCDHPATHAAQGGTTGIPVCRLYV